MATSTRTSPASTASDDDLATTARGLATDVADKAAAAAARLPEAANATGVQIGRANALIQRESDEVLAVGTSLSRVEAAWTEAVILGQRVVLCPDRPAPALQAR